MLSSPTKILFLIPSLAGGGAERLFSHLLLHLDRSLFEPHLAVLDRESVYLKDLPADVAVHNIGVAKLRYALPGIVRIARRVRARVIFSTLADMNMCVLLAKPLLPRETRLLVRETAPPQHFARMKRFPGLWLWLEGFMYRSADMVICPSEGVRDDLIKHCRVSRDRTLRIYNPVDFEKVTQLGEAGSDPYSGHRPQLVAVGRLSQEKGIDILLAALPLVRDALPETRLAILGEGSLQSHLETQARNLGIAHIVNFCGFQSNPWRFMKHADVFVLPSRFEGLPNALLEATALKKPIVATRCPGGVAELEVYMPQMQMVPPENPRALADAIISACAQIPSNRQENKNQAMTVFSMEKIVREYSELFLK